jgi:hypothetical protein
VTGTAQFRARWACVEWYTSRLLCEYVSGRSVLASLRDVTLSSYDNEKTRCLVRTDDCCRERGWLLWL